MIWATPSSAQLSLSLNMNESVSGLKHSFKTFQSTCHYCSVLTGPWEASALHQTICAAIVLCLCRS